MRIFLTVADFIFRRGEKKASGAEFPLNKILPRGHNTQEEGSISYFKYRETSFGVYPLEPLMPNGFTRLCVYCLEI